MKSNHNLLALTAIVGAIVTAALSGIVPIWWLLACLTVFGLGIVMLLFYRQAVGWVILACLFCLGGFLFSQARYAYQQELRINQPFNKQSITVTGIQVQRSEVTWYGTIFALQLEPREAHAPVGKVMVVTQRPVPANWYGHRMKVCGIFNLYSNAKKLIPEPSESRRFTGVIYTSADPIFLDDQGLPFPYIWANRLRESMLKEGNATLKAPNARLLHGMIFSDKLGAEMTDLRLVNELRRTGTIHLLSVSGLHIGFIIVSLTFLLGQLKIPKAWRILPLTIVVWFYIMMTGMDPPVLRAGIMVLIFMIGELLGTGDDNLNRLSLAAVILLLFNPYNLFEIGFQLSFTATLGVVWLYPILKEYFPVQNNLMKPVWYGLLVSIGAQLMITPLMVAYFQLISWISPLVNLLLIIPAEFIVVGGLLGEGSGMILPWMGKLSLTIVDWGINLTRLMVHFFAGFKWAASWSPVWPWPWIIAYYLGLLLSLNLLRPNLLTKKRQINYGLVVIGTILALNITVWTGFFLQNRGEYLQVSFIDVGQGDAILIRSADGVNTLIDGGDVGKGRTRVTPYLRVNGVEQLDSVFVTHGHRDHLGGLAEVLQEIPATTLYLPKNPETQAVKDFFSRIKGIKIRRRFASNGQMLRLGKNIQGEILTIPDLPEENDRSLVLVFRFGKNKLLLTGDLGAKGEEILARKYPHLLRAAVLKVAHHGSNYTTGLDFLTQVKPKVAVISAGARNRFGHPGSQTLNRLHSLGVKVYRTDRHGIITLRVYRDRMLVSTLQAM